MSAHMGAGLEKSTRVDSRTDRALQDWGQALAMHKSKDGRVRKTVTFKTQLARSAPAHPKYFRWNPREQTCELLDDERGIAEGEASEASEACGE